MGKIDALQRSLRNEFAALQQHVASEIEVVQNAFHKELEQVHWRLSADLKVEVRASIKQEQNNIVALDEQLWMTDQRLGQRIDELLKVVSHNEKVVTAVAADMWGCDNDKLGISIISEK